jgi:ubiquinone/menaquinone biosynthesis C-methylase UbiE
VSMTLRCINAGALVVVDPCEWPASVSRRYHNYGIEFIRAPGEELNQLTACYDEVLCYNVLQHVQDPAVVVKHALACVAPGGVFRIFEWCHIPADACHPNVLTPADLLNWLRGARILRVSIPHLKEYWSDATAFCGVFQP